MPIAGRMIAVMSRRPLLSPQAITLKATGIPSRYVDTDVSQNEFQPNSIKPALKFLNFQPFPMQSYRNLAASENRKAYEKTLTRLLWQPSNKFTISLTLVILKMNIFIKVWVCFLQFSKRFCKMLYGNIFFIYYCIYYFRKNISWMSIKKY